VRGPRNVLEAHRIPISGLHEIDSQAQAAQEFFARGRLTRWNNRLDPQLLVVQSHHPTQQEQELFVQPRIFHGPGIDRDANMAQHGTDQTIVFVELLGELHGPLFGIDGTIQRGLRPRERLPSLRRQAAIKED